MEAKLRVVGVAEAAEPAAEPPAPTDPAEKVVSLDQFRKK